MDENEKKGHDKIQRSSKTHWINELANHQNR